MQVWLLMLSSCLRLCHLSADVLLRIRDRYDGAAELHVRMSLVNVHEFRPTRGWSMSVTLTPLAGCGAHRVGAKVFRHVWGQPASPLGSGG